MTEPKVHSVVAAHSLILRENVLGRNRLPRCAPCCAVAILPEATAGDGDDISWKVRWADGFVERVPDSVLTRRLHCLPKMVRYYKSKVKPRRRTP